jgi:hypothetical protein
MEYEFKTDDTTGDIAPEMKTIGIYFLRVP